MKIAALKIIVFSLVLSSCNRYNDDFSKINIIGFENVAGEEKTNIEVELFQNGEKKKMSARTKFRGGSSIGYAKKNFALSLAKELKFNGLKKDDDWVLGASVVDKTFLRNVFCYHYFRKWNKNNEAPKTKYTDVFVDDKYYGFFVLTEKLDVSALDIDKKSGLVYKEPAVFRPYNIFLDSVDLVFGNYYHQKFPKGKLNNEIVDSLKNFILYSSDSLFEANVFELFDIENIIDWHIMLELTNNGDGLQKNFVFYQKSAEKKFRIALWDCDHSLGRDGDYEYNMLERNVDMKKNVLLKRLLENDNLNYSKEVEKRWKALRKKKHIDLEKFYNFIDKEAEKISPFVKRNFEKWPLTGWPYKDANGFEQEIDIIKEYLELRITDLDKFYNY